MKNRRIEGSLSKTINLGNYESIKINVGLSADITDKEDLNACYNNLFVEVEQQLLKEIKEVTPN